MHKPSAPSIGGWLFILYMTTVVGGLISAMASDGSPAAFAGSFAAALVLSFIVRGVGAVAIRPRGSSNEDTTASRTWYEPD
ncbi:MAG TPA: hypothetical protein VGR29_01915 [Thermomicrobiales bacterium]|nr:hypothetical protein [Thermomicrobiales bacterium]